MDLKKEIWDRSLPNFGYVIDMDNGSVCVVILGGQRLPKAKEYIYKRDIFRINIQMQNIYDQGVLNDDNKKELVRLMEQMYSICVATKEGLSEWKEQEAFIATLSNTEKAQLAKQVQMLKDSRRYYPDFF